MDKSIFDSFVNSLKSAEVDKYSVRFEGGNRTIDHNSESSFIVPKGDFIYGLETCNNYGKVDGSFNLKCIPYDNIDNIAVYGLTTKETIKVIRELGLDSEEGVIDLIKKRGAKVSTLVVNRQNIGELSDEDGKVILHEQIAGRVTSELVVPAEPKEDESKEEDPSENG